MDRTRRKGAQAIRADSAAGPRTLVRRKAGAALDGEARGSGPGGTPDAPADDDFSIRASALPAIVWVTDTRGRATQMNRAGYEFAGVTPAQMLGDGWRSLLHPDDRAGYEQAFCQAVTEQRPFELDCRVRRADGIYRWLLNTGVPRLAPDGAFAGHCGYSVDITQRKEAEVRLHAEIAERRRSEQVVQAQKGALLRTLRGLAANPTLDAYLGEVLKALTEQLEESSAGIWLTEGADTVRLYMDYQNGRAMRADQTDHPGAAANPPNASHLRGLATSPRVFDVATDPALAGYRDYLLARGVIGILIVPMFFGEKTIGAFSVRSTRRRTFSPEEIDLAQNLAHQATLAIQLTRLAESERETAEGQRRVLAERVMERTGELNRAVDALNAEVVERQLTERVSRGQTDALTRTLNLLAGEPDLDTFLGHVLSTITRQLDAPSSSFWFYDAKSHEFDLHMSFNNGRVFIGRIEDGGAELPTHFNDSHPDFQHALETRRPVVQNDVPNNPRVARHREWLIARGIKSMMLVPVTLGETVLGLIIVSNTRSDHWRPEEPELAQALAHQASLAVQLTRLAERSRRSAVLEERNRMAREIHDTLAQTFTGIVIHQEAAKRVLPESADDTRQHIARTLELARTGLAEARRSVARLRCEVLEASQSVGRDDLPAALLRLVEQMTAGTEISGEVVLEGQKRPLTEELRGELLRIGQEAITNALRHGHPTHLRVELTFTAGAVRLRVWDDGLGFDPSAMAGAGGGGFGLIGMRERAERIAGQLLVTSQPEGGTEVIVSVQT